MIKGLLPLAAGLPPEFAAALGREASADQLQGGQGHWLRRCFALRLHQHQRHCR